MRHKGILSDFGSREELEFKIQKIERELRKFQKQFSSQIYEEQIEELREQVRPDRRRFELDAIDFSFRDKWHKKVGEIFVPALRGCMLALLNIESAQQSGDPYELAIAVSDAARHLGQLQTYDLYKELKDKQLRRSASNVKGGKAKNEGLRVLKEDLLALLKTKRNTALSIDGLFEGLDSDREIANLLSNFESSFVSRHQKKLTYKVPQFESLPDCLRDWMDDDPEYKDEILSLLVDRSTRS
jgi:hypothetical protein